MPRPATGAPADRRGRATSPPGPFEQIYVLPPDDGPRATTRRPDRQPRRARRGAACIGPVEAYIDLLLDAPTAGCLNYPFLNQDLDAVEEMLDDPRSILGLADAGAHVGQIMDASQPTFFLSYWVRDRGRCPLEEGVRRLTSDTADLFGIADRGVLRAGRLRRRQRDRPRRAAPAAARVRARLPRRRRPVRAAGRRATTATIVNGEVFMEDGEHTGALPGRLLAAT